MSARPIDPPATLGVLGGGQLGMYFVQAARDMGYRTAVLDPDPNAPASRDADLVIAAGFDDPHGLDRLAQECAVVTAEFENPPATSLVHLSRSTLVRPGAHAFAIAQDRRAEKTFLAERGLPTVGFAVVNVREDMERVSPPESGAILKTARLGYDGKGQIRLAPGCRAHDLIDAWQALGAVPCVLEEMVPLDREISVIVANSLHNETATYPVTENVHVDGILDTSTAPYTGPEQRLAVEFGVRIARDLDYVGVLGVEMFVSNGRLLVNEIAPRPHNSGHWTLDAARTSQFAQHVLMVCGHAPAPPEMTVPSVAMVNLLGDLWQKDGSAHDFAAMERMSGSRLHLYGKDDPLPRRKMGHLTVTADDVSTALLALSPWRRRQ